MQISSIVESVRLLELSEKLSGDNQNMLFDALANFLS